MLTSSRPYVRKKATLVLYKLFCKFPQVSQARYLHAIPTLLTHHNGATHTGLAHHL